MERTDSFETAWRRCSGARDGEPVSSEVEALVRSVHAEVVRDPAQLPRLRNALESLLLFLASPAGRTHANCSAVDLFFTLDDAWPPRTWEHLPEPFADVLADIGGALHDTVKAPHIAENFSSLPEQLLARVRSIQLPERAV
jgi:hypothetical protein